MHSSYVFLDKKMTAAKKHHTIGSVHWHPGDPHVASAPFEKHHDYDSDHDGDD